MIVSEHHVPNIGDVVVEGYGPYYEVMVNGVTAMSVDFYSHNFTIWYLNIGDEESPEYVMEFLCGVACRLRRRLQSDGDKGGEQ